jgi:ferritin-like metal-binding protein YciE
MKPRDLLLKNLDELYGIERTLADRVLPETREQVSNKDFRNALDEHLEQTREHVENVQKVFQLLKERPRGAPSPGFEGLRRQHEAQVDQIESPDVRDLFIAGSVAHTEHYEISAYNAAVSLAAMLGEPEAVRLLEENLHDEEEALEKVEKRITEKLSEQLVAG